MRNDRAIRQCRPRQVHRLSPPNAVTAHAPVTGTGYECSSMATSCGRTTRAGSGWGSVDAVLVAPSQEKVPAFQSPPIFGAPPARSAVIRGSRTRESNGAARRNSPLESSDETPQAQRRSDPRSVMPFPSSSYTPPHPVSRLSLSDSIRVTPHPTREVGLPASRVAQPRRTAPSTNAPRTATAHSAPVP